MSSAGLSTTELASIRSTLAGLPVEADLRRIGDDALIAAYRRLVDVADHCWVPVQPEVAPAPPDDALAFVVVRKRRQVAYSLKLANLTRDPLLLLPPLALSSAAVIAAPALYAAPPATFPSFLLGIAFAWLRAFAQPIGYGEAALLHYINQLTAINGLASHSDLSHAGDILVSTYGYPKGKNSNEIVSLLRSLLAWGAIEEFDGGIRSRESVPFGLGAIEYVSK